MAQYVWAEGSRISVPAEEVYKQVERIRRRNRGLCAPESLVDAARPERSPIHHLFGPRGWEDEYMAEQHRITLAQKAIRSIRIVVDEDEGPEPAPAYVSVKVLEDEGVRQGYMASEEVRQDPELHRQVVNGALSQMQALRRRYNALKELTPVWRAVDEVEEGLTRPRRRSRR